MTQDEARAIFDNQMSIARTFKKDIFEMCEAKGIPEDWVIEFLQADGVFDNFFDRHSPQGKILNEEDVPRAELLKKLVRLSLGIQDKRN